MNLNSFFVRGTSLVDRGIPRSCRAQDSNAMMPHNIEAGASRGEGMRGRVNKANSFATNHNRSIYLLPFTIHAKEGG